MKNKQFILSMMVCLFPIVVGVCLYQQLPDLIPVHFNAEGIADDFASKAFAVFGMPLIMECFHLLCVFMMKSDPKMNNYPEQMKKICVWIVPVLSCVLCGMIYLVSLGFDLHVEKLVPVVTGVLVIVMGNYLPKTKQNYTLGIKLPWTLHSEDNWFKTHRLAGFLYVVAGCVMVVSVFFPVNSMGVMIFVLGLSLIPVVYSWWLYQKEEK